ncbi:MAG: phosphate ABC transporter permease subunit PstC [Gammaproteobacteria bacterium]|nr:phosphate ABC transporter permease subunit PstC [Gammaproteobacteria bacterium]
MNNSRNQILRTAKVLRFQDAVVHIVTFIFASLILLALLAVITMLTWGAQSALSKFGLAFFWYAEWDIINEEHGAFFALLGTVLTSTIALLLAVPMSFGIALFLTETCPTNLRRILGTAIELLAAIPSIIYGMFGLFIFAPWFAEYGQPGLYTVLKYLPIIGSAFGGSTNGIGILTAGLILSFMILPFIAAVMRDVFEVVPPMLRESAYGLGCTQWEVMRYVVLPYTRIGVLGGVVLGLGRALGETMAVTFVIGNANRLPTSVYSPGTSIASTLANEFGEASDLHLSALFALGLLLFFVSLVVILLSKWLISRSVRV